MNPTMPNSKSRLTYVGILCVALSVCGAISWAAQPEKEIDRLAKAYNAASTELERRAVCLDAIDNGVIARGRSIAVVDAVFGTSFARKLPRAGELETGVVDFHPSSPSPNDEVQAAHVGWYLAFEFDSGGKLQNYFLTNAHQK